MYLQGLRKSTIIVMLALKMKLPPIYSNSFYVQSKIFDHIFHCQSDVIFFSMFVHVLRSVSLDVEYYCYCLLSTLSKSKLLTSLLY